FLAGAALCGGVIAHSGLIRLAIWRAGTIENVVTVGREAVLGGDRDAIPAAQIAAAQRAAAGYAAAAGWGGGGGGPGHNARAGARAAWLCLVLGDYPRAERLMERVMQRWGVEDPMCADLGRAILLQRDDERALKYLRGVCTSQPTF